jgi:FtsP/CotA-like multicopper oxidase with cupredoxin domain
VFTRRNLLKLGLLTSGYTVLASGSGLRRVLANDDLPASPSLTPFIVPLPQPPAPPPVPPFLQPDCEAGGFIGTTTRFFRIVEEEAFVSLHPDLPATKVWRYRPIDAQGSRVEPWDFVLGPTFMVRVAANCGDGVVVRMRNELPANHVGFGVPDTTTHFHGGHHPAASDGFPDNVTGIGFTPVIKTGEEYDYIFPLLDPGFRDGAPDPTERPSTMWYHDHLFDFTGPNVVRGLAGFYLVFDEKDSGDENDPSPDALRLPSGEFDIPLVVQDRRVGADGQLIFDALDHDGFLGDTFLVNGAVQPFLDIQRRKYRFRLLNGSNARFYRIFLTGASGQTFPMTQIATEGGLLAAPIPGIQSFQIAPAERVEVVVDFRDFPNNTNLFFENRLEQDDGRKPGGVLSRGTGLLQLRVKGDSPAFDPSQVPSTLRPFAAISEAELASATFKEFKFDRSDGAWTINGQLADLENPLTTSIEGQGEIWHLDSGGGWAHPVHLHLEYMRVLRRNGNLPALNERDGMAKKDTVVIGADFGDVDIFVKFRDYPGPFVFHCHNIEHEDMRMMARMDIQ